MNKKDLEILDYLINTHYNDKTPVSPEAIVTLVSGFDKANKTIMIYENTNKKIAQDYVYFTDLFTRFLLSEYDLQERIWHSSVNVYAKQNKISWVKAFRILLNKFIKYN